MAMFCLRSHSSLSLACSSQHKPRSAALCGIRVFHHTRRTRGLTSPFRLNSAGNKSPENSSEDADDLDGNKDVQEALLESLRLGIKRQQTKDEVEESFQQEVQKLREIAEQAKEELEQVAKLNSMRQDLAFGSTLADLLQDMDQLEDELRKSRAQTEADQREFEQWERDTNIARSQGLFFQSLYPVSSKPGAKTDAGGSTSGSGASAADRILSGSQAAPNTRRAIQEAVKKEVVSPWRLYLLTYMVFALVLFGSYDLLSSHPHPYQDTILLSLAAVVSFAAWNERQAVIALEATFKEEQTPPATSTSPPPPAVPGSQPDAPPAPPTEGEKSG